MTYKKMLALIGGAWACLACDQWLKMWMKSFLFMKGSYPVSSFLTLVYAWNPGISFGLFPCYSSISRYFLLAMSLFFTVVLVILYAKSTTLWQESALVLIIGGALGNAMDRFKSGAVFDFIRFHWHEWDFPAFNLADMLITIGFLALMREHFQWKALVSTKK
jgi:signal peptidase II